MCIRDRRNPAPVSTQDAHAAVDKFIADYKERASGDGAPPDDAAGGVLLSQLTRLRSGLSDR